MKGRGEVFWRWTKYNTTLSNSICLLRPSSPTAARFWYLQLVSLAHQLALLTASHHHVFQQHLPDLWRCQTCRMLTDHYLDCHHLRCLVFDTCFRTEVRFVFTLWGTLSYIWFASRGNVSSVESWILVLLLLSHMCSRFPINDIPAVLIARKYAAKNQKSNHISDSNHSSTGADSTINNFDNRSICSPSKW